VFPVFSSELDEATIDDAWWRLRDQLTKSQRFLVAGRKLMESRSVFRAQKDLAIADVVILGRVLEADGLVVTQINQRKVTFTVYDATNGFLLWEREFEMNRYQPIGTQLLHVLGSLCNDFIAGIPYHGFQVLEPNSTQLVRTVSGSHYAWVELAPDANIDIGDLVQWVRIKGPHAAALFMTPYSTQVYADGHVEQFHAGEAKVKIHRVKDIAELKEYSLVRLPKEYDRLRSRDGISMPSDAEIDSQWLSEQVRLDPLAEQKAEKRRNENRILTSLAFLGSLASFLLIAF
jgi:hypothetical protein